MYDATRAEETPDGVALSNSKDGMLICDPLGYPRLFAYNYGFQFVALLDRVVQFFEWGHAWRDIWIEPYATRESAAAALARLRTSAGGWGFPHSDQLRVVERYRRTSFGTLEAELTIIDPVVFKKPWTTRGTIQLSPGTELWEYMCVPSESEQFNEQKIRRQVAVQ
jgi:hypothetical protein